MVFSQEVRSVHLIVALRVIVPFRSILVVQFSSRLFKALVM